MHVVPGIPPAASSAVRYVVRLDEAVIPGRVLGVLRGPADAEGEERKVGIGDGDGEEEEYDVFYHFRWELLPTGLDSGTHAVHFKMLLWAEEFQSECVLRFVLLLFFWYCDGAKCRRVYRQDLGFYDIHDARLTRSGPIYYEYGIFCHVAWTETC